jgi:hypothetical protein
MRLVVEVASCHPLRSQKVTPQDFLPNVVFVIGSRLLLEGSLRSGDPLLECSEK